MTAPTTIEIEGGKLRGNPPDGRGILSFKGIRFAAPPVGALRWRPPQPVPAWTGVRVADTFGPNAPQRILFSDIDPLAVGVSEDCLYLNVWTPDTEGRAPVLFWIHGGGFAVGSGAEPRYIGARLAAQGIVVITVNTRLNALGLLAHPALTAESKHGASGNFAMLDLVAALEWVSRNIAQFGGDPSAVTVAGESAGAMFVSMLMASPLAKGLFHRAIGQSGAQFPSPEKPMLNLVQAEEHGLAFAKKCGAATAAELRALPVEAILDASPGLGFWPLVDGYFLPESPAAIFAAGRQNNVPLLAGWNKDEGFNFNVLTWGGKKDRYADIVNSVFGPRAEEALRHYPASSEEASARALGGDLVINHGAWAWIESQRKTGKANLFRYQFNRAPKTPKGWFDEGAKAGAFHSCELLYVFNNLDAFPWLTDANDQAVASMSAAYWVNFVKTGDPNGNGLASWPSYRDAERPVLFIDVEPSINHDPDHARHAFLASVVAGLP